MARTARQIPNNHTIPNSVTRQASDSSSSFPYLTPLPRLGDLGGPFGSPKGLTLAGTVYGSVAVIF